MACSRLCLATGLSTLLRSAPQSCCVQHLKAAAFSTNNQVTGLIAGDEEATLPAVIAAGMCASSTSGIVRSPIELVKTAIMQARNAPGSSQAPYCTSLHCALDAVKTEGLDTSGLFRAALGRLKHKESCSALCTSRPMASAGRRSPTWRLWRGPRQAQRTPIALCGAFAGVAQ